ncbi:hypothetical protein C8F04DRAFT_1184523 [Mycena alexandri]|uniref:Uncharacterized protein n=1 Tax=Mycena alexandri TaxID=1745969 RepID=A0AAD6WZA4_9AGAR|nr:hypothetical protein C8F04DRAFT_1184523 [Mycena alexandri]
MTSRGSLATKGKKSSGKRAKDSQEYRPGLSGEEKAARHRKAQQQYRARSTDIHGKQRIYAAEKRARRRRCDPPKALKKAVEHVQEAQQADDISLPPSDLSFRDFRAPSYISFPTLPRGESEEPMLGTTGSPSPDELIACDALADLAQGGPRLDHAGVPVARSKAASLSNVTASLRLSARCRVAWRRPPLQATGTFGLLTHVQSAQMRVALMNREPPHPPTPEERSRWAVFPPGDFDRAFTMSYGRYNAVDSWRLWVNVAMAMWPEDSDELNPVSNGARQNVRTP